MLNGACGWQVLLRRPLEVDLALMVHADVFVMSLSSVSYVAALLRGSNVVVAPDCMRNATQFQPFRTWDAAPCCTEGYRPKLNARDVYFC